MGAGLFARVLATTLLVLPFVMGPAPAGAADFDLSKLKDGGYVVLLRHVKAGGSDSDDFDLADCRTQRQVGAAGRKQAAELKQRFLAAGITELRLLSSQYCRALQTAELLDLGRVTEEPALNYYHWRLGDKDAIYEGLRRFIVALEAPSDGPPLVLVGHTHAFNIIGLEAVDSGGGLILRPNGSDRPEVVGAITAP
ncbi:MAG TPA: histidine phosphatase family protein [Kiloniellaceae bacterium]|nr:histidine phosphatase family protein [Kiloniellaceae bacterium]HIP77066.1 histidine phosphatase family protein [Kiloniellaceae bacterium]